MCNADITRLHGEQILDKKKKKQMQREQSQQAVKPQLMWSYRSYNLAKNDRKKKKPNKLLMTFAQLSHE